MSSLRHAWVSFVRDSRSGELTVLLAAVVTAVAALSAVGFATSRMAQLVRSQAGVVLAADLRLESGRPLPADHPYIREARSRGLLSTGTISFSSVVFSGDASQLATVLVVEEPYPLRGKVRIADSPYGEAHDVERLPAPGEVWVEARLLTRLNALPGGLLSVGDRALRIAAVLDHRPDQGAGFTDLAPTVMVNRADLESLHLLVPGSRASWALLFSGGVDSIGSFSRWLRAHKSDAERQIEVAESSEQMQSAVDRADRFLNLAALVTVLLAAVAIAMSARQFAERKLDAVALMKCMGARHHFIVRSLLLEVVCAGCLAALAGVAVGFMAQAGIVFFLGSIFHQSLPQPSWMPVWVSLATTLIMLIGCASVPLLELGGVSPARVLRRQLAPVRLSFYVPYLLALLALTSTLYVLVRDARLLTYALVVIVVAAAVLYGAGRLLVSITGMLRGAGATAWRYGLANVARRGHESALQVVAFGLAFIVLLLLVIVRHDLLKEWQATIPVDAPNHFLVNIRPVDVDALGAFFEQHHIARPDFAPWVRGRLVAVNGQPMRDRMPTTVRGRGFAEREQNLSWSGAVPIDNAIVAGSWWDPLRPVAPSVSVAEEFQRELGLALGDTLTFDVAGEPVAVTLTSIRHVRWDGFRPNFFLLFSPGVLSAVTGTYMTSVHLDHHERALVGELVRAFPSVTIFDVEQLLEQIREVTDRAALAIELVFAFTLVAGVLVLLAVIRVTRDERSYESALLRTLGASRWMVLKGVAAEFIAIGVLAGVLGTSGAALAGWWLATQLFHLPYSFNPWLWTVGIVGGALLVGGAGVWSMRSVVNAPPISVLRGV